MGMTLQDYLDRPDALSRSELCEALGISNGRFSQLKNDGKDWPPELALKAEEATGGLLSASDLSGIIAQARAA